MKEKQSAVRWKAMRNQSSIKPRPTLDEALDALEREYSIGWVDYQEASGKAELDDALRENGLID